jgi:CPA2 family monovalent cation:H+ antiporter-2
VLLPALDKSGGAIGTAIAIALGKAAIALAIVVLAGPRLMRAWLGAVARRRSTELFVLNVLFVTLLLAWLTGLAGLSMVLGAFLAGMLISETEYRFQVEEDIKPFRDVLLGLFFITIGALLDWRLIAAAPGLVVMFVALLVGAKFALIATLSRAFGATPGTALRVALALAQAGEFGFVLLPLAGSIVPEAILQPLLAAMVVSMIATPFVIAASDRIVMRVSRSEWMERSLQLHRVAAQSMETERHVIILGYGRNGQRLARLLQAEGVPYVALDLDPERVREAAAAGDRVVFADSSRRESLLAAGISRAAALVVTFADTGAAVRVLSHIRSLGVSLPVIVRARDESDIERLTAAGATEVVPEAFESGVMLASHTLVVVGVPLSRVMRRVAQVRDERYQLLRGLFHAPSEREDDEGATRLHAVTVQDGDHAIGKRLRDFSLKRLSVEVRAVRRRGERASLDGEQAGVLQPGDVVVMLGRAESLDAAESLLLRG